MTAQQPRNPKSCSRLVFGCMIASGLALLLILAAGAFLALHSRPVGRLLTTSIRSPVMDQRVEINRPVPVAAEAASRAGTSRVEVYADGALILAQDSSAKGETSLMLIGNWTPLTPGRHALMARGYAGGNGLRHAHADSEIVYVNVAKGPESTGIDVDAVAKKSGGPNPSLDALAQYLGTTPDELRRRNPGLGGISPSEPLPSGSHIDAPPRAGSPASPPSPPPPPPPIPGTPLPPTGLAGSADCTSAVLTWTASPDAQTYRVYRAGPLPAATHLLQVADGLRGTNLRDTLPGLGDYDYQVASVREGQESLSLPLTVSTPTSCPAPPPPAGTATDLVLTVAMVDTTAVWQGIYCYVQVNGSAPERIPAGDFNLVAPETSNSRYYNLTNLPGGGRVSLTGQPATSPVTLNGECIGRTEPTAPDPNPSLGTFAVSHPQADWDGSLRTAPGGQFNFSYCLGPSTAPCTPTIPGATYYAREYLDPPREMLFFPPPTNLRRTVSIDACGDLPTRTEQIDCAGASGVWGRQTLFWDWQGNSQFPRVSEYQVHRTTYDLSTGGTLGAYDWPVNPRSDGSLPTRVLLDESDLACDQRVEYRVGAASWYPRGRSALSEAVSFTTPPCVAAADVTVYFVKADIGPVADAYEEYGLFVPASDDDLEVYGDLFASGGAMSPTVSHTYGGHGVTLHQGEHFWGSLDMYYPGGEPGLGHNYFRAHMSNNLDTITFGVALTEIDTAWTGWGIIHQLPWCVERMTLPARSTRAWSVLNQSFTLSGGTEEADCTITVSVRGAPAP